MREIVFFYLSGFCTACLLFAVLWAFTDYDKPIETQISIYQVSGDTTPMLKAMCASQGIDYENGEYIFTCPKCKTGGAHQKQTKTCSVYFNWYTDYPVIDKLSPGEVATFNGDYSQTYCGKCYYPIGTDWKLIDLIPKPG